MNVIFEALVKNSDDGGWFIELKDTIDNTMAICKDLNEFEKKIEKLGNDYGGRVDEVKWISHKNLSPQNEQELRIAMMTYYEKYKDQLNDKEE